MAKVLLGATGSVAAIKVPDLFAGLVQAGHEVRVVATEPALYFFDPADLPPGQLIRDADEWPGRAEGRRWQRGDAVPHIELRRWADLFVIAPLDANTLAKLAGGLCDNALTCVWRAWDSSRPVVLAPAMNTMMWQHPLTGRHLRQLASDATGREPPSGCGPEAVMTWVNAQAGPLWMVSPEARLLACGDIGTGAMAEGSRILTMVQTALGSPVAERAHGTDG